MIQHCLAYFRKDSLPTDLYLVPIPTRNSPIAEIIPSNAYAYFVCDIDVIQTNGITIPCSTPKNCSPKTYLGGKIYDIELAKETYKDDEEMLEFLSSWDAKYIIAYDNAFFPFYDEDIHISINPEI